MANGNGNGNGSILKLGWADVYKAIVTVLLAAITIITANTCSQQKEFIEAVDMVNKQLKSVEIKNVEQDGKLNQNTADHINFREDLRELKSYHKK